MDTLIRNGRIITPSGILEEGCVALEGGRIADIAAGRHEAPEHATVIDAAGAYVAPGFIDLHTHGAGGCDFMDGTVEAYLTAARTHAQHGTTLL